MTGGLLNLVATGNQNVILNGNPKKSFFKSTYLKYTNLDLISTDRKNSVYLKNPNSRFMCHDMQSYLWIRMSVSLFPQYGVR